MITIAETQAFANRVSKLLEVDEQKNIIDYLSNHPKSGTIIQGCGGIRKLRWGRNELSKLVDILQNIWFGGVRHG